MSPEDFFVVHQKGAELITGHQVADVRHVGATPDGTNTFGCVKRTPLGYLQCMFLETEMKVGEVLTAVSALFETLAAEKGIENPVDDGSSAPRRMSSVGHREVIPDEPWFVGGASAATVEKGLEGGMVGDYVVRESVSTPGA